MKTRKIKNEENMFLVMGNYYIQIEDESLDEMMGSYSDVSDNPHEIILLGHKSLEEAKLQVTRLIKEDTSPTKYSILNSKLNVVNFFQ